MSSWRRLLERLSGRADRDLDRELRAHLELEAEEQRESGLSAQDARYAAQRVLGNLALTREDTRAMWGWTWLEQVGRDTHLAVRVLRWNPGFAAVVVLALGLGIGANAAIYSILNAVYLRLLPVEKPEQLVVFTTPFVLKGEVRANHSFSYPLYREVRDRTQTLQGLIAYRTLTISASVNGFTERIKGALVSGNYFATLGVRPAFGALITPEDDEKPGSGGPGGPVAVLSHGYWMRNFGGDPSIAGRTIRLSGQPFTIAGVAQAGFTGTELGELPEVFAPMMMQSALMPDSQNALNMRRNVWLQIMGRLNPGQTVQQAEAELTMLIQRFNQDDLSRARDLSAARRKALAEQRVTLLPGSTGTSGLRRGFSQPLAILMAAAAFVLLIACANVANLLLTRATGRQREIAVRLALGATRGRLLSQLLVESVILAMLGSAVGLVLSRWVRDLVLRFLPQAVGVKISLDGQVLAFGLLLGLLTALIFGLVPALQATKPSVTPSLKSEHPGSAPRRLNLRKGLVVVQVALSLLLLTGTGLFVRSLRNLEAIDAGFVREKMLLFSVDASLGGYPPERGKLFYEQLLQRVSALPGVRSAAMADFSPLSNHTGRDVFVEGYQPKPDEPSTSPGYAEVTPGYFATMGIPMRLGRDFTDGDKTGAPKVAVVNETFARNYFGDESPLGRRMGFARSQYDFEIVGVVKDSKYGGLREPATRMVYLPLAQTRSFGLVVVHLRTAGEPAALTASVRAEVQQLDRNLPVVNVRTVEQEVDRTLTQDRLIATLSGIFSLLALVLSAVGLYGVVSYAVSRRVREMGIRMALGAKRAAIASLVLKEAAQLVAVGIALGLAAAYAATKLVASMLYGVEPTDPASALLAVTVLAFVALAAAWIPARRASRVDPMVALRYE